MPSSWFCSITLTPTYSIISYGNIVYVFLTYYQFFRYTTSSLGATSFFELFGLLNIRVHNFHLLRSWMQLVQFFIFSFFMSFIMSSSHLFFGLPSGRVNIGFHLYTFFLPFSLPAFDVNGQASLIFVLLCDLLYSYVLLIHLIHRLF
jgi:hypothetical protein